jgi:hypothetical protein
MTRFSSPQGASLGMEVSVELYLGDECAGECHACHRPGKPVMRGQHDRVEDVTLCEGCWDKLSAGHRTNRAQFDELIARGVNRRMANRITCVRLGLSTEKV